MPLIRDLVPLFTVHLCLLLTTLVVVPGNVADVRVQIVWTLFLSLGWLLTPIWMGSHVSMMRRYTGAAATSIAFHGLLVAVGSLAGWGINIYVIAATVVMGIAAITRYRHLTQQSVPRPRISSALAAVVETIAIFSICVYDVPGSNYIYDVLLQQQEMLENG